MASTGEGRKALFAVGIAAVIGLIDWFFMFYITSYNFQAKPVDVGSFKLPITVQWLPVLGIVLATFVAWFEVSARIFPRRGGPTVDPLGHARLLRAVGFSIMTFVCVLYIPYLLGSNWFWAEMSSLSHSSSQVRDFGLSLLNTQEPFMTLDPIWQYSVSQIIATAAMILVALALSRTPKRIRKPK
jgi:hypothetical protein